MIDMQEHRDALLYARAHKASKTSDEDYTAFVQREALLGGLS